MDPVAKQNLTDFGQYVAECMPKYVQKVQLTAGDELEILIAPEGVLPVITFLKDHHNAQFASLADICGLDMPTRQYRFEVSSHYVIYIKSLDASHLYTLFKTLTYKTLIDPKLYTGKTSN